MGSTRFRNPQALSSALASLGTLQPRAFGFLNRVDPLVSASNYYLVVYYLPRGFTSTIQPHGNSKDPNVEFHPTWPSTKELMKSEDCGPKEGVARISFKVGGILQVCCPGELPRNERQATYLQCINKKQYCTDQDACTIYP